jgi:type II secretory pathway component PulF
MLRSPSQDEREAYLFADVAAAADAGLTAEAILNGPATATLHGRVRSGATLSEGLAAKGLVLAPHEQLMLETAETAGTLARTLLLLASHRTKRAANTREMTRRLAYPLCILTFGLFVLYFAYYATRQGLTTPLLVTAGLAGVFGLLYLAIRQTIANPDRGVIPALRQLILDQGELPYLRSLHGLYSAGVKIDAAHDLAATTSPVRGMRERLAEVGRALHKGCPLTEALHVVDVLHPETRQMLSAGEVAGDLEAALERAAERRQTAVDLRTRRLLIALSVLLSALVYGFAAWFIVSFYGGLHSNLDALNRR